MAVLLLVVGLVMLVGGAELLVRGGGHLALALRVPALIVGLTVVAFGTSAPELAVSVSAAWVGSTEAALANVTGSNIANILLVLGIAAMVRPLSVDRALIRREIPAAVLLQVLVPLLCWDGNLGFVDGSVMLAVGLVYNGLLVLAALRDREATADLELDELGPGGGNTLINVAMLLGGIVILVLGAQMFVGGAMELATWWGFSERFIGLTVIAVGTSAPEMVTGAVSAYRGETELAMGNSIGSNILNVSLVLALTAMLHPIVLHDNGAWLDLLAANVATVLLIPIVLVFGHIGRLSGAMMIIAYIAYIVFSQG